MSKKESPKPEPCICLVCGDIKEALLDEECKNCKKGIYRTERVLVEDLNKRQEELYDLQESVEELQSTKTYMFDSLFFVELDVGSEIRWEEVIIKLENGKGYQVHFPMTGEQAIKLREALSLVEEECFESL